MDYERIEAVNEPIQDEIVPSQPAKVPEQVPFVPAESTIVAIENAEHMMNSVQEVAYPNSEQVDQDEPNSNTLSANDEEE